MKMFMAVLLLTFLCSSATMAEERRDYKVYDENYRLKYRVKDNKVYDENYRLKYRIEDNKVYDRDWNEKSKTKRRK